MSLSRNFIWWMKPAAKAVVLLAVLAIGLALAAGLRHGRAVPAAALPALQGAAATEHLRQQGLYGSLAEAMTAARYRVWPVTAKSGQPTGARFSAGNPRQRYHSYFAPDGVRVAAKTCAGERAEFGLSLKSVGYDAWQLPVAPGVLTANGDRIEYARAVNQSNPQSEIRNPQLTEWYVNRPDGLEQGFTLSAAPGERQGDERLCVTLAVTRELRASLSANGQAALLKDAAGGVVLRYSGLKTWDADGRELPSQMRAEGGELALEMDDGGARYPVTIDPVIDTQVMKIQPSDLETADNFGWSVAISGDTVIVGAPFEDAPGSNSGSAYIFERNMGGRTTGARSKRRELTGYPLNPASRSSS